MSNDIVAKAAEWGYDPPEQSVGLYLTLRRAGDKARIRIASRPIKFSEMVQYEGRDRESFCHAWVVIHKEIVDSKPVKTVRGFKAGAMIYSLIYSYIINEEWGDPTNYDLEIVRTEVKGSYYTVTPLPSAIGPISGVEKKLVAEAALDLNEMYLGKHDEETPSPNAEDDPFADDPKYEAPAGAPMPKRDEQLQALCKHLPIETCRRHGFEYLLPNHCPACDQEKFDRDSAAATRARDKCLTEAERGAIKLAAVLAPPEPAEPRESFAERRRADLSFFTGLRLCLYGFAAGILVAAWLFSRVAGRFSP